MSGSTRTPGAGSKRGTTLRPHMFVNAVRMSTTSAITSCPGAPDQGDGLLVGDAPDDVFPDRNEPVPRQVLGLAQRPQALDRLADVGEPGVTELVQGPAAAGRTRRTGRTPPARTAPAGPAPAVPSGTPAPSGG